MTTVLVLSDLWPPFPGGAERLIFNVARHLHRRPQFVVWALTGYENAQQFDGPPLRSEPIGIRGDHDAGAAIVRECADWAAPDVILTHHLYAYEFRNEIAALRVPIVQVVLNGARLFEASIAVYISEWVRDQCGDARPGDMVITPPAFDDVIAPTHGDAIGFVKPIRHKGVELVYSIARHMPDTRFVVLRGEWQDLEIIEQLPNVEFMEPVDDIRDFYARCRVVLMPSISEDAGTVAQECALNRIPCVSSDAGGLVETNGGIVLAGRRPEHWARVIRSLDDPATYNAVVEVQSAYMAKLDHAGALNELAARIESL